MIPGLGGSQRLPRLIGPSRAKDMILTGRYVGAEEAMAFGLADRVVADDAVYDEALALAQQFAAGAPLALAAAKRAVNQGLEVDIATGCQIERLEFAGPLRHRRPPDRDGVLPGRGRGQGDLHRPLRPARRPGHAAAVAPRQGRDGMGAYSREA